MHKRVSYTRECHTQENVFSMTHVSRPHSLTCTLTLTPCRASLGHPDPRAPHFSNAPMNLRTPWRKKWIASPLPAEESGPPRPTSCQLTNKLCSFSTPTATRFEADNNQVASLVVEQLRVFSFLVSHFGSSEHFVVVSFASQVRRRSMPHRERSAVLTPAGWFEVIRGPRPPSVQWPPGKGKGKKEDFGVQSVPRGRWQQGAQIQVGRWKRGPITTSQSSSKVRSLEAAMAALAPRSRQPRPKL